MYRGVLVFGPGFQVIAPIYIRGVVIQLRYLDEVPELFGKVGQSFHM